MFLPTPRFKTILFAHCILFFKVISWKAAEPSDHMWRFTRSFSLWGVARFAHFNMPEQNHRRCKTQQSWKSPLFFVRIKQNQGWAFLYVATLHLFRIHFPFLSSQRCAYALFRLTHKKNSWLWKTSMVWLKNTCSHRLTCHFWSPKTSWKCPQVSLNISSDVTPTAVCCLEALLVVITPPPSPPSPWCESQLINKCEFSTNVNLGHICGLQKRSPLTLHPGDWAIIFPRFFLMRAKLIVSSPFRQG